MAAGDRRGGAVAVGAAVILAVVTGYVDAVGFARLLGVFPANQSGNLVFLGIALGGDGSTPAWRSATAIVAFALGIALAFLVGSRIAGRRRGPALLAVELVLLGAVMAISGPLHGDHLRPGFEGWGLVVLIALAMGVQTEVIRHAAGVAVATTYETGALVRVGEAMTAPLRRGGEARYARRVGRARGHRRRVRRGRGARRQRVGGVAVAARAAGRSGRRAHGAVARAARLVRGDRRAVDPRPGAASLPWCR